MHRYNLKQNSLFIITIENDLKHVFQFLILTGNIDLTFNINRKGEFSVMATNKRTKTFKNLTIIRPSNFSDEELQKMKSEILKISPSNQNEAENDMKKR